MTTPLASKLSPTQRARLRARRGRIPFVQQLADTDCGLACLAMVLGQHGRPTYLDEIHEVLGVGRDGASARAIVGAAERFGLRARGVRVEVEALAQLGPGAILHWSFNHFVVLRDVTPNGIHIIDPRSGVTFIAMDDVRRHFTGVAIQCSPGPGFDATGKVEPGPLGSLVRLVARTGEWTRILLLSVFLHATSFALPILTGALVDRIIPRADTHLLAVTAVVFTLLTAFQFVASLVRAHLLLAARTRLDVELVLSLIQRLCMLEYAFFQRRSTGDLMMRLNGHVVVREVLTNGLLSGVLDGSMLVASFVVLFALSAPLGILVTVLAAIQLGAFAYGKRELRQLSSAQLSKEARCQGHLLEMLTGMETLKGMGCEDLAAKRHANLFIDAENAQLRVGEKSAWLEALSGTLRTAAPLFVVVAGAVRVVAGEESLGAMLAQSSLAVSVFASISTLTNLGAQIELLRVHAERMNDIRVREGEERPRGASTTIELSGKIELRDVTFRYAGVEAPVIDGVSLRIAPGEFVAIVGRSGSGKSTLASLLLGLYAPTLGKILFDGRDLRDLDAACVRRQMGVVTQRAHVFSGSVRSNIALADPTVPLDRIEDAARAAGIHDDIRTMPMAYETVLADGGSSLSGGQRQRVALARALISRPKVLLLDEATSALDAKTERTVERNLATLSCTRIIIAHRLSTVVRADRIIVMEGGRIVEEGTHGELVSRGGVYADLVGGQSGDDDLNDRLRCA